MNINGATSNPAGQESANRLSRSRSRRRAVTDAGQTNSIEANNGKTTTFEGDATRDEDHVLIEGTIPDSNLLTPPVITSSPPTPEESTHTETTGVSPTTTNRPTAGGIAFPFKLGTHLNDNGRNASVVTLQSQAGVVAPQGDERGRQLGESMEDRTAEGRQSIPNVEIIQNEDIEEVGKEQWRQGPQELKMRGIADDDDKDDAGGRRATLEDKKGVLYHGPVNNGNMNVNGNGNMDVRRPLVDRAETASLD